MIALDFLGHYINMKSSRLLFKKFVEDALRGLQWTL